MYLSMSKFVISLPYLSILRLTSIVCLHLSLARKADTLLWSGNLISTLGIACNSVFGCCPVTERLLPVTVRLLSGYCSVAALCYCNLPDSGTSLLINSAALQRNYTHQDKRILEILYGICTRLRNTCRSVREIDRPCKALYTSVIFLYKYVANIFELFIDKSIFWILKYWINNELN